MDIVIHFDSSFTTNTGGMSPTSVANLEAGIKDAALDLSGLLSDPNSVFGQMGKLFVSAGLGECGGVALAPGDGGEGGPVGGTGVSWSGLLAALGQQANTPVTRAEVAGLPAAAPPGMANSYVSSAQEKAWGWLAPDDPGTNGQVGFSNQLVYAPPATSVAGQYDPYRMALHELTHMIRIYGVGAFEAMNYTAPGVFADPNVGGGYLSWDGGVTNQGFLVKAPGDIADFVNNNIGRGDINAPAWDALGLVTSPGVAGTLSARDIVEISALGFHLNGGARMTFLNNAHWKK